MQLSGGVDFKRVINYMLGFRGNLYPLVEGGRVPRSMDSEQWTVKSRASGRCSCFDCALAEGYFLQRAGVLWSLYKFPRGILLQAEML